jgi:hypothetical protein
LASLDRRREFHARFAEAVGGLSNANLQGGFPSFTLDRLADPARAQAFAKVADDFVAASRR